MKFYHTVIVGGGPSGMAAAIQCAGKGQNVLLIDRCEKIGKKILVTGNGKCNLTNMRQQLVCYRGNAPDRIRSIFSAFGLKETMELFQKLGLLTRQKEGYVYPYNESAASVREAFEQYLQKEQRLDIMTETSVTDFWKRKDKFIVSVKPYPEQKKTGKKEETFSCRSLIVAAGGLAGEKMGCSGSGYQFAKEAGHHIVPPLPALTALKSPAPFLKKISGVRNRGKIALWIDEEKITEEYGELQWTNYGISGVAVFQVSRYAAIALEEGKRVRLSLDFMPEYKKEEVKELINTMRRNCPYKNGREIIGGCMPAKLSPVLLREAKLSLEDTAEKWSDADVERLARAIKDFPLRINGYAGYEKAQVTRGGVPLEELTDHLESCFCPGLFFAGEVTDVDGICGGYNLQWAFSSGSVAGKGAFTYNEKKQSGGKEK